jgi:hypothetical protein
MPCVTVSHVMVMSLRSKWAAGKVAYASFVYLDGLEAYATLKRFFRPALLRRLPDSTRINPDRGASLPLVRLGPPRKSAAAESAATSPLYAGRYT